MSLRAAGESYDSYGSIVERRPLLATKNSDDLAEPTTAPDEDTNAEGTLQRRQIGLVSAVFIIFNRIIGTGQRILKTDQPRRTMWLIGAIISAAGTQVYITWGTAFPWNGGEKNYLEYLFPKPSYLITSMYASNGVLLAWTAGNSLVFGEYMLKALNLEPTRWGLRFVALACITFAMLLHGTALNWGLRLQNFLGIFKLLVLFIVVGTGFVALSGHLHVEPPPRNFERVFEGTKLDASSLCVCLYNVLWSYVGFSNVNYALSEVKNPKRTIRIAGPLAIGIVTVLYMLANIAYLAGASKEEIVGSGRLVAALLFRNVYGPQAERVLSVFVAMSALGNVLAVIFAQGRVNQELGREGIIPFSKFWASNRPFNAPLTGLWLHWLVCVITMFALHPGDAYNFVINTISYPLSVINAVISFGVIYLSRRSTPSQWPRVGPYAQLAALSFGLANVFLFVAPFVPPPPGGHPYEVLPYWTHAVGGWAIFGLGFAYWFVWAMLLPWWGRYRLVRMEVKGSDGLVGHSFSRIPS
ncbi:hypothetical protein H0H87_011301 [Tephrocybe sp. NHM501043]|nr:hypothetical protein H0H87_011301 [Tephrocybe sp. NHM501043]